MQAGVRDLREVMVLVVVAHIVGEGVQGSVVAVRLLTLQVRASLSQQGSKTLSDRHHHAIVHSLPPCRLQKHASAGHESATRFVQKQQDSALRYLPVTRA